jgi:catechol 2,3-dioxygenase-like lactoylglutathione lyase family enzyme
MTDTGRLIKPQSIFKATAFNHLSYGVSDYARSRDYYMDMFGMKCVFDDGQQCSLSFGNPPRQIYIHKSDKAPFIDHWGFSIENFEAKTVGATLQRLGLNPKRDSDYSWTILDPDGYRIDICAETGLYPGTGLSTFQLKGKTPSGNKASRPSHWKATAINHMSYRVSDYARTRDFYMDLFGMRLAFEDGIQSSVAFSTPEDAIFIRKLHKGGKGALNDHWAISVENFDFDKVEADIIRLGITHHSDGDSAWTFNDPDGYQIDLCAETGLYPGCSTDFFHQTREFPNKPVPWVRR